MRFLGFGRGVGRALLLCASFLGASAALNAGEPAIRNLGVRGLQVGGTTTLIVDGDELGTAPRLLLPFPVRPQLKAGAKDTQATFDVTLGADVVPGYYHLRVVTDGGVSLPVVIAVDRLPQRPLTATPQQLPVALHGVVNGSTTAETQFVGKAGQKVLVELEAQRLGSKLRPVAHLYSPKRLQVAWSWPTPALSGDTRLEAALPEDGTYTIAVHDAEYAAPAPSFFRLRVGQWSFVDQVFPPVIAKGRPQAVELLGLSPKRVDVTAPTATGALPLAWPGEGTFSGPRPFVLVSSHAEVVKDATSAGKVQELPAGPVGVSGRLLTPYEEDRYRVPVTPKTKLRLEVFAERIGSPLDTALLVRNEQGADLVRVEDSPGTVDPVLEYAVPDKVTAVIVAVVDAQGRGGPRGVYRLVVEPQQTMGPKSGFHLVTPAQRLVLPVGGNTVIPVLVERRGYQGGVELSAEGLPAGVRLEGTTIPEEADGALVTVRRSEGDSSAVITRWHGKGADGAQHTIGIKNHPLERLQPWLATEIAVAPSTSKAADFLVDWRGLPSDAGLVPAKKLALPLKVIRPAGNTVVRFTLLTSQRPVLLNNQPDPNQTLRLEKAVELAPKAADGEVTVLVPALLAGTVYDVTVQAELLSPDKKTVQAVAYAPVRRMAVRSQVVLRLDGPPRIQAALDPKTGAKVIIQGQVERREGLTGDVTLTLTGLPAGITAAPVNVKAGTTAFTVNIVVPPTVAAGEIGGLKLSATAVADPKVPNVRVRSRDVDLTLALTK